MLVGAILGAAFGARAIPRDLISGLYRHDALARMVDALSTAIVTTMATAAYEPPPAPRLGRPQALPLLRYPFDGDGATTTIAAPRDFAGKLAAIRDDATRAGGDASRLRYVRGTGPVLLPAPASLSSSSLPSFEASAVVARVLPPREPVDANAACHGRANVASVIPSSSIRWIRSASRSVRATATSAARSCSRPFSM